MLIKMLITFDFNPETNEYTPVKQEIIKDKIQKTTSKATEAEDSAEPQITLESNKYVVNNSAATLMGVAYEDRLDIKYQPVGEGNLMYPIIGTDINWKTKSGNKLTKGLTVSCRGNANNTLSEYGDTFTVTPWKNHNGLFVLVGNKDRVEIEDKNIKITEDQNPKEDLPLDINLDEEETYKIDDLSFDL